MYGGNKKWKRPRETSPFRKMKLDRKKDRSPRKRETMIHELKRTDVSSLINPCSKEMRIPALQSVNRTNPGRKNPING